MPLDAIPSTLRAAAGAMVERRVSAHELTRRALQHITACEPSINAFIAVDGQAALDCASDLDERLDRGERPGPLHGLPLAVKDNIPVVGLPTTLGSFDDDRCAPYPEALVAQRLRTAGAVLMGKNHMHELALGGSSANPHHGDCRNPWDTTRSPGGSSGGSAAAVASGEVYASLGTDSGGSVRSPAAYCGVVGLKPSHGRISMVGVRGTALGIDDVGILARTAADAADVFRVLAPSPKATRGEQRLRVGVWDDPGIPLAGELHQALGATRKRLEELGATTASCRLEGMQDAPYAVYAIAYTCVAGAFPDWGKRRARCGADVRALVDAGALLSATEFLTAQRSLTVFRERMIAAMAEFDMVLLPTTPDEARPRGAPAPESYEDQFTAPANVTGFPAIAFPVGKFPSGLPLGLQLIGWPGGDEALLATVAAYESRWPPDTCDLADQVLA